MRSGHLGKWSLRGHGAFTALSQSDVSLVDLDNSSNSSRGSITATFTLVFLLFIGSGAISYYNACRLLDDSAAVEQAHLVLEALDRVLTSVVNAETGQRGYIISGESRYLEPYHEALAMVHDQIAELDRLTDDYPRQQSQIPAIKEAIADKLEELHETLKRFEDEGFNAAQLMIVQGSGHREMEFLREKIGSMQSIENQLLAQRSIQRRRTFRDAILGGLAAMALGIGAIGLLAYLLRRFQRTREENSRRLYRERDKLEITLKSIGDAVISTDAKCRITMMNEIAEQLTGWSFSEASGKQLEAVFRAVYESTDDKIENPALRALAEGEIVGLANHAELISRDGSRRAIHDSAGPIRDSDGTILGAVLVFRDVEESRNLERELDFRNRLLELAVDVGNALTGGATYADSLQRCCEALIDHVEGAIARIWTFDPPSNQLLLQAHAGSDSRSNDPHKCVPLGKYKIGRIAESRKEYHANLLVGDPMFPDQEWVLQEKLISFAGFPLVINNRLLGVMALYSRNNLARRTLEILRAVAQEIAVGVDRQRSVSDEREHRNLLAVTLESIGDCVMTTDVEGNVAFLNQTAEELLGCSSEAAMGQKAEEVLKIQYSNSSEIADHPITLLLKDFTRVSLHECQLVVAGSEQSIPLEISGAPIQVEGSAIGAVLVFRDVSHRIRLQQERERLFERAENERLLLEAVLRSLPAGVIIADAQGKVTHMNSALKKIWGSQIPRTEGINDYYQWKGWWPESGQQIRPEEWAMSRALTNGEVCPGEEVIIERFDGGRAVIINSASPVRDASGKLVGGVVAEIDITELTETQTALRDARSRLHSLLEAGELGTWEWDINRDQFRADQNLEAMFGIEPLSDQERSGVSLADYLQTIHEEDRVRVESAIQNAVESHDRLEVDYRVSDSQKKIRWLVARGRVDQDAAGKPVSLAGMVVDVTDRRKAEIALAESRKFLEETLDALPSHVAVLDERGTILVVNRAWREFALHNSFEGTSFGVGSNYLQACEFGGHSEVCEEGKNAALGIRRVLQGEVPHFEMEYPCHSPDTDRWFLMRVNRFDSSSGLRVIISHENITTRVLAEQSVRESEEKFRTLADNMSQFAWMADPKGNILWYNKRWFDYTGTTLEEMRGWGWMAVHHPDHLERVVKRIQHSWDTGELWEDTFPLRGKDGEYRWFLSRANPIYDEQGNIVRWFGTNTDITKHRELEQALLEADLRKDQFIATLGHELRNPLAGILGGIEVLQAADSNDKEREEAQQIISRQSKFMERLVDDLLDVSRIVRGKITLKKETVDVCRLLEEVVRDCRRVTEQSGIELVCELGTESFYCHGDRERLRQVFTNLLHNSCKFTEPGGKITAQLSASEDNAHIELHIIDTGIGMTAETLASIFQPFAQADTSLDRGRGGLGLGLAIVKGLIELHGGSVEALSSGLGKGSTFVVKLSRLSQVAPDCLVPTDNLSARKVGPFNVLVVDDRRDASFALVRFLKRDGHQVSTAADGPEAVDLALETRPDVIVCDIGLPGFDGYEVARRIRASREMADTLMIAVTGYGQPQDQLNAEEAGFDCHIVKPVDRKLLQAAIMSWAESRDTIA